ncbi:FmdB family zinc ribbon protein [Staphylococcus felis]|uniref:FmdB family zinc ribbon protein n=1 Tax=Staphylococcus felis TaxID=46127 RepID=UPI003967AD7D
MPNYSYTCASCGTFTIRQRMSAQHQTVECPTCSQMASREFQAFQTYQLDQQVKKRIERGQEPRIVKGKDLQSRTQQKQNVSRPWMIGH